MEAVQKILDSLDDIHALQDSYADEDILRDMLTDNGLCALLQVNSINRIKNEKKKHSLNDEYLISLL